MNELKNNRFVRAGYFFVKQWLGVKRNKFGFCGKDVVLSPPFFIDKPGNVYLMTRRILEQILIWLFQTLSSSLKAIAP